MAARPTLRSVKRRLLYIGLMAAIGLPFEQAQMDWGRGPRRNIHGNAMRFRAGGPETRLPVCRET